MIKRNPELCTCPQPCNAREWQCPSVTLPEPLDALMAGTPLATNNSGERTNAIVLYTDDLCAVILSDFGNVMRVTKSMVFDEYYIPKWFWDKLATDYPVPTVKQRIDIQIDLLNKAKGLLND